MNNPPKARYWIIVGCIVVPLFLFGYYYVVTHWFVPSTEKPMDDFARRGQFGDMFGAVSALFSALGFIGLIITLALNSHQLHQQSEDMRSAAEAKERSDKLFAKQTELLAKQAQFYCAVFCHYRVVFQVGQVRHPDCGNA